MHISFCMARRDSRDFKKNGEVYEVFKKIYGGLGCVTAPIYLTKESVSVAAKVMREADLIYVGGGSTLYLMRVWKKTGFDKILRNLAGRGKNVVLGGLSAGAICWFEGGFGDSVRRKGKNLLVGSKDLGLLSGICCPHYDDSKIKGAFKRYMVHQKNIGIALENLSALEIRGSKMTAHQVGGRHVYFITVDKGKIKQHKLISL